MPRHVPALLLAAVAAACAQGSPGSNWGFTGPAAPDGTAQVRDAVDGLEVGHRLMAAGEYDLALRAYYRSAAADGVNVDVLSAVGSANLRLGRLGQSEQMLRRALEADETFVPALNNLGVVLAEQGRWAEAAHYFRAAFAQDSGRSDDIRENLRRAIAKSEETGYSLSEESGFSLVRRGTGQYLLLSTP